jgi:hypothetical protein
MTAGASARIEQLGRFLLRGLRIGASTISIIELLGNDWTGGISAGVAWLVFLQVARSPRTDSQLGIGGGRIQLPTESPLRQKAEHQLSCGVHQRARAEVPADHGAAAVSDGDVEVGAIGRKGAGETEDLQLAMDGCGRRRSSEAQLDHREAADSADHTAGLLLLLAHPGFQRLTEIVSRLQPQRHHLHGLGPSTSPWIITKAST